MTYYYTILCRVAGESNVTARDRLRDSIRYAAARDSIRYAAATLAMCTYIYYILRHRVCITTA